MSWGRCIGIHRSAAIEVNGLQGILVRANDQRRLAAEQKRHAPVALEAGGNTGQSAQRLERVVQVSVQSGIDALGLVVLEIIVANLGCKRVDLGYCTVDLVADVCGDA